MQRWLGDCGSFHVHSGNVGALDLAMGKDYYLIQRAVKQRMPANP